MNWLKLARSSLGLKQMNERVIKLSGLQKAMSRQMISSWTEVPQFHLETEINCAGFVNLRKELPYHPSFTAIFTKIIGDCLVDHPYLNASWVDDHIITYDSVNIAVAMDTHRGLLAPVISEVANKSLEEVNLAIESCKQKSHKGNFTSEELTGGTFTISNLGMYPIRSFSAIINAPQVAILAVPQMYNIPSIMENGTIGIKKIMRPVLSLDHRVVDGATGAKFISDFVELIEKPEQII